MISGGKKKGKYSSHLQNDAFDSAHSSKDGDAAQFGEDGPVGIRKGGRRKVRRHVNTKFSREGKEQLTMLIVRTPCASAEESAGGA